MTYQRRRGLPATVWCTKLVQDNRGNDVVVIDDGCSHEVIVWHYPQRSSRAEVPGQVEINATRIGMDMVDLDGEPIENLTIHSRVDFLEGTWELVVPPQYHHGTRHTRHWSLTIKQRPPHG